MIKNLINFVAFQAGWFACVLGAANGLPWLGLLVVGLAVGLHLALSEKPAQRLSLIMLAIVLGLIFDSLLVSLGWLRYPNGMLMTGIAPYWILAMWALFATTLNASMSWLNHKLLLASVMGAVFGPLSYMGGQRLGALEFIDFNAGIVALALIWALAMPLLVFAATRFDGTSKPAALVPLQVPAKGE